MDDDRQYQRWHEADEVGLKDDADTACSTLFASVARQPAVSPDFQARTLSAIASALERDARRAKRIRSLTIAGGLAGAAAGLYVGSTWILGALTAMLVGGIDLLVGVTVRTASAVQGGADLWTLLSSLGHAAAAFVTDPTVTVVIFALQGIAMVALITLQRLLGSDRESIK